MDVRDFFLTGGGPGRLTARRLHTLLAQLPDSSRLKTKLIEAGPDERWGPTDYLLADVKDWLQYVFLIGLANATGKKPPAFTPARRPSDAAVQRRKELQAEADQERRTKILNAMRTGDWSEVGGVPEAFETKTHKPPQLGE